MRHSYELYLGPEKVPYKLRQCDMDGNPVGYYMSVAEAAEQTGINKLYIHAVLCGKQKSAGGFKWYRQ